MKKYILVLGIVLVLTFMITLTAYATKPISISGYFDNFVPGDPTADPPIPTTYCWHTGESYGNPDGFMTGCAFAYITPGLADHGVWEGWVGGMFGTCEYLARNFKHNISRVIVSQCSGDLEGLHFVATGSALTGLWEGTYHWED